MSRLIIGLCGLLFGAQPLLAASLTLEEAMALARTQNPTLQDAALAPVVAAEEVARARGAELPQVDLQGGYTMLKDAQAFTVAGRLAPTEDRRFAHASLAAEQTLYDFGRTAAKVARTEALEAGAQQRYRGAEQAVLLETVVAYYRILEGEHLLQTATEEVAQREEHRRVAESLLAQGVVTRNDLLQAQVQLAASRQLQLQAQNDLENDWLRLNYLTGRPAEARDSLQEPVAPPSALPALTPEAAVAGRPDLLAQIRQLEASRSELEESRSQFRPILFARAGLDYVENSHVAEQTIYSATAGLKVNLFDGFSSSARVRQSLERQRQEQRKLADLQARARLDYQSARNDVRVSQEQIAVAEEAIRQGEENLRINRKRYQEQVGTGTEVLDAQTLLSQARTNLYRARFGYQLALARVRWAMGDL